MPGKHNNTVLPSIKRPIGIAGQESHYGLYRSSAAPACPWVVMRPSLQLTATRHCSSHPPSSSRATASSVVPSSYQRTPLAGTLLLRHIRSAPHTVYRGCSTGVVVPRANRPRGSAGPLRTQRAESGRDFVARCAMLDQESITDLSACVGFLWVTGSSFFHCVASPFHSFVTTCQRVCGVRGSP